MSFMPRTYTERFLTQMPAALKQRLNLASEKTGLAKSEIMRTALAEKLEKIEARK